jgi:hypothetical protein
MGLRFAPDTNVTEALERLCEYTLTHPDQFDVFTTESFSTDPGTSLVNLNAFNFGKMSAGAVKPMPERYHFSRNYRIAPVWIVPRIGYALTDRTAGENGVPTGVSLPYCISCRLISVPQVIELTHCAFLEPRL